MGSGLLKKANLLSQKKGLAFSNFIQKYNKKTFAILSKQTNFYFVNNSNGLDADSILSSYSTNDFWNGLITEKKVFNFSEEDNSLNDVLQLFSFELKQNIKSVSIYSDNSKILILCNSIISDHMINDFNSLDYEYSFDFNSFNQSYLERYSANTYTLNYSDAVKAYSESKNKPELTNLISTALINEINNQLIIYFHSPNCILADSNGFSKVIIFSENDFEDNLILQHIKLNLKHLLKEYTSKINISYEGKAQTIEAVKQFLKVE